MPVDYSQFLEPEPTPITPAPSVAPPVQATPAVVDYSQFLEPEGAPANPAAFNDFTSALAGQAMPADPPDAMGEFVPGGQAPVPELPWGSGVIGRNVRAGVMGGANLLMGPIAALELAGRNVLGADLGTSGPLAGYMARRDAMAKEEELAQGFESNLGKDIVGAAARSISDPTIMLPASAAGSLAARTVAPIAGPAAAGAAALTAGTTAGGVSTVAQDAAQAADDGQLTGKELANSLIQGLIEQRMGRIGGQMGEMRGISGNPMAGKVGEFAGDALVREPLQEGATSLAQDTARAGIMEGRVLSGEEGLHSTAIGAGSGGVTSAAVNAPSLVAPARPEPTPKAVDAPIPEELSQTQTDLRPVDVQAIESQLANEAGIPSWVPDDLKAEIVERFRPDERSQIPGLSVPDFNDADHLKNLVSHARDYVSRARSESDIDSENTYTKAFYDAHGGDIPENMGGKKGFKPDFSKQPKYTAPSIEDDQSIVDVGNSPEDITPETEASSTNLGVPITLKPKLRTDTELGDVKILDPTEGLEREAIQGEPKRPDIRPEFGAKTETNLAPIAPATPTRELRKFLSPKGVIAYNSMSELERQSPEVQSTLAHLKANPDLNGDAGNLQWAQKIVQGKRIKAKPASRDMETRPEPKEAFNIPAPEAINFDEKQGEYKSPEPSAALSAKPLGVRGAEKGQKEAREKLGPALGKPVPAPPGYESVGVRVFKDAGMHHMQVKESGDGRNFVAWDPIRGKAMVVTRSDAKGRPNPEGAEFRPVGPDGYPTTMTVGGVSVFNSVEEAEAHVAKLPAPKDKAVGTVQGEAIGAGVQDVSVEDKEVDLDGEEAAPAPAAAPVKLSDAARRSDLKKKLAKGELTDEEIDELEDLEAAAKAPVAKRVPAQKSENEAIANSPLTPKARMDIADKVEEDMEGKQVGLIVRAEVKAELRREPSHDEMVRALEDLVKNGIITRDQAVVPGKDIIARSIGAEIFNLAEDLGGPKVRKILEQQVHDLTGDAALVTVATPALKSGQMGNWGRNVGKAMARVVASGRAGTPLIDWFTKLSLQLPARGIAAVYPSFAPILSLAQRQIDNTRIAFQNAYHRLDQFRTLEGKDKFEVNGALIQFRLENRPVSDFGKPIKYTDPRGKVHGYTLTPEQIKVVQSVHAANKKLLTDYVNALLRVLNLPVGTTLAKLQAGINSGTLPKTAEAVVGPLRVLEENADNYVPLKRHGDFRRATVYDPVKLAKATNRAERKAARRAVIRAESLDDYRKQVEDALARWPASIINEVEDLSLGGESRSPVTKGELSILAEAAGVPDYVFQDFLDAGVGEYLATRGVGARFVSAEKIAGFSHDMLRANASHAKQMSEATMRLQYRHALQMNIDAIQGDPLLKKYAERFVERVDTPIPGVASMGRSITTLYYLGLGAMSAAINSSSSLLIMPATTAFFTRNPLQGFKAFKTALGQVYSALKNIMGKGYLSGEDMAEQAAKSYAKSDPALAASIRHANKAGAFVDTYDREAENIAKWGELNKGEKFRAGSAKAMMHFFSKVESANRLATFIAGMQTYRENKGYEPFEGHIARNGFRGRNSEEYGEWFSDFINGRMDKTEMLPMGQGSVFKDRHGKEHFAPSRIAPLVYALKSWTVHYTQQQALIMRSAFMGGWIDRAAYSAYALGFMALFGASTVIPGFMLADTVAKAFSKGLEGPVEMIAESGTAGRIAMKGAAGYAAEKLLGERAGVAVDNIASRIGGGNIIPTSVDSLAAPYGVGKALVQSVGKMASGDTQRIVEGAAAIPSKATGRLAESIYMKLGNRGKTSASGSTVVPSDKVAEEGAPFIDDLDIAMYANGLMPPVIEKSYRMKALAEDIKTSNDKKMNSVVNRAVDAILAGKDAEADAVIKEMEDWNNEAEKNNEEWKIITPDSFRQAIRLEIRSRALGVSDPRSVPKSGRETYFEHYEETIPDENVKEAE